MIRKHPGNLFRVNRRNHFVVVVVVALVDAPPAFDHQVQKGSRSHTKCFGGVGTGFRHAL